MPRLEYFLVAEDVSVDEATNRVSIFNVLEEVGVEALPALSPRFAVIGLWRRELGEAPEDCQAVLRIVSPAGKLYEFRANFRIKGLRHRLTMRLNGLYVEQAGDIHITVEVNGRHDATHVITVSEGVSGVVIGRHS